MLLLTDVVMSIDPPVTMVYLSGIDDIRDDLG
jgi:hypothetical protein